MKKLCLLLALSFVVALASVAGAQQRSVSGCVKALTFSFSIGDKPAGSSGAILILPGDKAGERPGERALSFGKNKMHFLPIPDFYRVPGLEAPATTPQDWAKWEKAWWLLNTAREAKVQVSISYDERSKEVQRVGLLFDTPCVLPIPSRPGAGGPAR